MRDKVHTIMKSKNEYYLFDGEDVRYFTQLELERLQTLPEGYTKVLNRNKAAGCIGDGWTVDVIAHILKGLK
jgi:DNA (cytosine-5)-methyltransferase 3A